MYSKRWKENHPEKYRAVQQREEAKRRARGRNYHKELREKIFDKLGHSCINCGFANKDALQFDHIFNDGASHRRNHTAQSTVYLEILKDTQGRYQVLCANCNSIKQMESKRAGAFS